MPGGHGAIVDLDSTPPAPPPSRRDRLVLGALGVGCVALGLLVVAARAPRPLAHDATVPAITVVRSTFSVLAHAQPAPSTTLELPRELGVVIQQRGPNGETGLIARDRAVTMVRLRSGDVVVFGAVAPARLAGAAITVRGSSGVTFDAGDLIVVRWSENGASYEITSRTLDAQRLAEIAAHLR